MREREKLYRLPDALEKKGVHLKCPICGGDELSVSSALREYVIPAINKDDKFKENFEYGNPVYNIVCNNCSYVMMFSIPIADMIVEDYDADE